MSAVLECVLQGFRALHDVCESGLRSPSQDSLGKGPHPEDPSLHQSVRGLGPSQTAKNKA